MTVTEIKVMHSIRPQHVQPIEKGVAQKIRCLKPVDSLLLPAEFCVQKQPDHTVAPVYDAFIIAAVLR